MAHSHIHNPSYMKKWSPLLILSIYVGLLGGLAALIFHTVLDALEWFFFGTILPLVSMPIGDVNAGVLLIPVIGALFVGPIVYYLSQEARGHGVPEIIRAQHFEGGHIPGKTAFMKFLSSVLTIASGGSAGTEGPIAHIGASIGSFISRSKWYHFKSKKYRRMAVSCGVAAAVSAIFNAPLGGAIFAMEVVSVQHSLSTSIPLLISSVIGNVVTTLVYGSDPIFSAQQYVFGNVAEIPFFLVAGILLGILSFIWKATFFEIGSIFERANIPPFIKPAIGAVVVGVIGTFTIQYGLMGGGYSDINAALQGHLSLTILIGLGLLKVVATSFTLGSGGSGGVFGPTLYIGAMFGAAFGLLSSQLFPNIITQPSAFALIGMGALFAAACRTPLTTMIMIPELTSNYNFFVPIIITASTAYVVSAFISRDSMYLEKLHRRGLKIEFTSNPLEDVQVKEVMTPNPVTISPDLHDSQLFTRMLRYRHPGFAVVEDGEYLGFVKVYHLKNIKRRMLSKVTIREVVKTNYPTLRADDNVYHALNLMTHHRVGRLPVIEEHVKKGKKHRKLVGIFSKTDVIKAYHRIVT